MELAEITHAPTGCMLIKRTVLEDMIKHYPELQDISTYHN